MVAMSYIPNPRLCSNPPRQVFGEVLSGMEIVTRIEKTKKGPSNNTPHSKLQRLLTIQAINQLKMS
jgi:cyclophilin family peptidyl-prolyl cis-trans isomerase